MSAPLEAIVFDKDGVIIDFERTWAPALKSFARVMAAGDDDREREYLAAAGYDAASGGFTPGSIWAAGNTLDLVEAWAGDGDSQARARLGRRLEAHCAGFEQTPIIPGEELHDLFSDLRARGLKLAMATNDASASARRALEGLAIDGFFDCVVGYDSVANPKPAPDPLLAVCDWFGMAPERVAMVGDNAHDADMARAAGAGVVIGVLSGNGGRAELAPLVDHLIETIAELPALVDELNQKTDTSGGKT